MFDKDTLKEGMQPPSRDDDDGLKVTFTFSLRQGVAQK